MLRQKGVAEETDDFMAAQKERREEEREGEREEGKVRESLNIALKNASSGLFSSVLLSPSSFHSLLTMRQTGAWDFWGL